MSFEGKVVLVTGASSGIGAATAVKFAEQGAYVCLVGRNLEKLNNVAKKCEKSLILKADISKEEEAKKLVNETVKQLGKIDILINNAGIVGTANFTDEQALKDFDHIMATNLRGPVMITNHAVPHIIQTKGNIINISSVASLRTYSQITFAYNTSKAALDHFTRSIALELAPKGVRVNTVNPGPVKTDIFGTTGATESDVDAIFDSLKKLTALDRISDPEEVADLVLFLASDKAKAITGATFVTDNGATILSGR